LILPKKNEKILLYYYDTSGQIVFIRFLRESRLVKKPWIAILGPIFLKRIFLKSNTI
jgi:hypothetical protein